MPSKFPLTLSQAGSLSSSMSSSRKAKPEPRKVRATGSQSDARRARLTAIADATIQALESGSYTHNGATHTIEAAVRASRLGTQYYAPDSMLSAWNSDAAKARLVSAGSGTRIADISVLEISSLDGARLLWNDNNTGIGVGANIEEKKIGVLNFASATKPGGGFLTGAQAQEESLARASALYPTLTTRSAGQFYEIHKAKKGPKSGYYTHAMVYSPRVVVFRDDAGGWVEPYYVDMLTSPAVNAGDVRRKLPEDSDLDAEEERIVRVMRERMARILFLFEQRGARRLVLGSFGTGVFRNSVEAVARIWAELLCKDGARFAGSFERVVFAVLGRETYETFVQVLNE
ncbi:hypothetical protein DENSPDRAFT_699129, partial [Dentipellis sp. KUC8613]